jgi:tetratricopeptide (TPR) repeat protein
LKELRYPQRCGRGPSAILPSVPRKTDVPPEVKEVADALLELSKREGLTRLKITRLPALLAVTNKKLPDASTPERARAVEDLIRTHVKSILNLQDRVLLSAGLNLEQDSDASLESRITTACIATIGVKSRHYIEPESAHGKYRYDLTVDLALRLLGGAPTYAAPAPPSDDFDMARRFHRAHRDDSAVRVLRRLVTESGDERERREAWRLLARIAYESGELDGAELAFDRALQNVTGMRRGGRLAMDIDRYARLLTEMDEYERAEAIVSKALLVFFEGRWLWRRYGVVKWYRNELLDAYSALTNALDLGYPAVRVFHARGQVLAELGRYSEAIEELGEVLRVPRSPVSHAIAHSARAFAMGMSGPLEPALKEFRRAEAVIPYGGWFHYWRGLVWYQHGRLGEAVADLRLAISSETTALNRAKQDNAHNLLAALVG